MHKEFLMGNEVIAMGALAAGVNLVSGYPGTPSTEVLETIAKRKTKDVYVEWSANEKVALEVAAGAAYSGARVLVTMKQVGLNVASDPLMCVEYVGIKGAMVILVADDPGPMSSQTEQDTRKFASYSKIPVFDPSDANDCYEMIGEAFEYSHKYKTPVIFRPTTRVDHGYASIDIKDEDEYYVNKIDGFEKDASKWVIFPRLSFMAHSKIEKRNEELKDIFSDYKRNFITYSSETKSCDCTDKSCKVGIVTSGISYTYVCDALQDIKANVRVLKISTPYPFPEKKALEFLNGLEKVLCIEELDPILQENIIYLCGKNHLDIDVYGKKTGHINVAGENTPDSVYESIKAFLKENDIEYKLENEDNIDDNTNDNINETINLPVRPPVLCAGCPHRASFYAVKQATKGEKTLFAGDIGCYTLGNAKPLDMTDTCLCMGAGLGIAQGMYHMENDRKCFAFVGDSTFFASAVTGVMNAYYNQADMTLVVLDNSTTAMTGHQPHPGTGITMMGQKVNKISIENVLKGIGLTVVETVNPLELDKAIECVKRVSNEKGVKAIIFKYPCIAIEKPSGKNEIDSTKCVGCQRCIKEIGCPAIMLKDGKVTIDSATCTGCNLCGQVCLMDAIRGCN